MNYEAIPSVVYTMPEIASVGATEEDLKAKGIAYNVGKFPFTANGRARATGRPKASSKFSPMPRPTGFSARILSAPGAGEAIAELCVLMEFGGSAEDLARTCHAHPTLSEAIAKPRSRWPKRAIHI